MAAPTPCLSPTDDGCIMLRTPWSTPAGGTILVDGHVAALPPTDAGPWSLDIIDAGDGALVLELTNTSSSPQHLGTVQFARWAPQSFPAPLDTAGFRELIHGGSFRSMASGVKCVGRKAPGLDFVAPSSMLTVFQADDDSALLLGVLPAVGQAFSEFVTLHSEPHFEASFGVEIRHEFRCLVDPGQSVRTSPVVALTGRNGVALMQAFGELWQRRHGDVVRKPPAVGWNSWDYYSGSITRAAMDENLAAAERTFPGALKAFVIDEGWEQQWGTWEPNGKFASGTADFCRHVKEHGCIPGIWTAPLLVNTYNPLFLEHPDWFAARADGQVQTDSYAYGPMAYLDVTKPDVIDLLTGLFRRLRQAGFDYFKVDFCHCILNADRFADPRVPRCELIRRAFKAIRAAIGPDAYLLSCGAPYESVFGLVDAVRSTGDIHIFWGHVLRNASALSVRWWMQGRLWNCDPDFLVVRGPDTAEPPYGKRRVVTPLGPEMGWLAGRELNEMEARTYALLVHLSGGDVVLGDRLCDLRPAGVDILCKVLQPRTPAAAPVDLFSSEQDLPRVWISRGDQDTLVGLFNWSDKPARLHFEPADHGLHGTPRDFWTDTDSVGIPASMPPRSSLALLYTNNT